VTNKGRTFPAEPLTREEVAALIATCTDSSTGIRKQVAADQAAQLQADRDKAEQRLVKACDAVARALSDVDAIVQQQGQTVSPGAIAATVAQACHRANAPVHWLP
jgi:hypothetical protein